MKKHRKDLQPFNMTRLNEIRELRTSNRRYLTKGENSTFWDELECILKCNPKSDVWEKKEKDNVVVGEIWCQRIGDFYYKHTVHQYEYMYVGTERLAADFHGNEILVHKGKQVKKVREFYIFPDGKIEMCGKNEKHRLVNNYGKPIYVISLKIMRNGTH